MKLTLVVSLTHFMSKWTKEDRKELRNIVVKNESDEDGVVEKVLAQLNAKGGTLRTKAAVGQQVRNCKTWTVELESSEEESESTDEESESPLGTPEVLRHNNEVRDTNSPGLLELGMNAGVAVKEDKVSRALKSIELTASAKIAQISTLKRRYDSLNVSLVNKKAKMDEMKIECEQIAEDLGRCTAELEKAADEAIAAAS